MLSYRVVTRCSISASASAPLHSIPPSSLRSRFGSTTSRTATPPRTAQQPQNPHSRPSHVPRSHLHLQVIAQKARPPFAQILVCAACSFAGSFGTVSFAQICPCGCGLLAPIIAPRFSKSSRSPRVSPPQFAILRSPHIQDLSNFARRHARQRQIVSRRKTNHATHATFRSATSSPASFNS